MATELPSTTLDDKVFLHRSILQNFASLPDPRVERTKAHSLLNILSIAILAVLAGADSWVAIETFGKAKQTWLSEFLDLENGIPSHDTFARVFARLDPSELQQGFLRWIHSIAQHIGAQVIAIDGKTLKQSYDRDHRLTALHLVSAWASDHRLVLGQLKVHNKSNEITAIPELLKMLDITGCVITLDAMGCQKKIASQIITQGGNYLLALKGNQGNFFRGVQDWFEQAIENHFDGVEFKRHQTIESSHHRIEKRECFTVPVEALEGVIEKEKWMGLKSIVMIVSHRKSWNQETQETRFYISSLNSDAEEMLRMIRSHWGIENSLHWTLDVTYREDDSRIRQGHSGENFALLRRMTVSLLNQEKSFRGSQRMKRYRAAMDNEYLLKLLFAGIQN